jgi:hypothetical protein
MRTFVVRVHDYRTSAAESDALCGVAEEIATGRRITFTSGAELLSLLALRETAPGRRAPE